ncbi:hypothetical protein [Deinococcus sp. YIM 134068]|uniref:hypothetical protein n=1 Tax=Deinococcus lichenicola TaxID=3118910 RepID=UPI002F9318F5
MTPLPALAGGAENHFAPAVVPSQVGKHPIDLVLTAPAVATFHSPAVFIMKLSNKADTPTMLYLSKPFTPDVIVFDEKGVPVWNCLNGEPIRTIAAPYELGRREQKMFACQWRVLSNEGERLAPGTYTVESRLHSDDSTVNFLLKSQRVQITIR